MRSKLIRETEGWLRRDWFPLLLLAMVVTVCFRPPLTHAQDEQKDRQKAHRAVPADWGPGLVLPGRHSMGTSNDRLDTLHLGDSSSDGTGLSPATSGRHLIPGTVNSSWNGGTGNWSTSSDWNPNSVPNNGGGKNYNVTIDFGGTDLVSLDLNATINSLVLGGSTGSSTLQNLSGSSETLNITGSLTVNKTGQLTFGNGSTLTVSGNATNVGSIDVIGGSTLTISGNMVNKGTVSLGTSTEFSFRNNLGAGTFTNQGTLNLGPARGGLNGDVNSATFGTLVNSGTVTNTSDSFYFSADVINSGSISLGFIDNTETSQVSIGTLTNKTSGFVQIGQAQSIVTSIGTIINSGEVDLFGDTAGNATVVSGNIINSGLIALSPSGQLVTLQIGAHTSLSGGGTVTMSEAIIVGGTLINVNNTIEGSGRIGFFGEGQTVLNNKGLIDAVHDTLTIQTSNGTTNTGTLEATGGDLLVVDGSTVKNTGGTIQANGTGSMVLLQNGAIVTGGTLSTASGGLIETAGQATLNAVTNLGTYVTAANSTTILLGKITNNGTIQANGTGSLVLLENGAAVTGGTLSASGGGLFETPSGQTATLSGLTNSGAYVMADNSTTTLSGKITNNGTISLDSTGDNTIAMIPTGGATLQGSGTLTLGTGGPNMIEGSNGKEVLTNASTIQGAGTISNLGLTNTGTILANAGILTIAPSTAGYAFINNGNLTVDSGSTVNITGPVKLSFQTAGTVTINSGGALSVDGSATYTQTKGSTTVDGNLSASNGISISGGTVFGNLGTLAGNFNLSGTGSISPGDGIMKVGKITINGMYAQGSTASALIDLGGTGSGTFDLINITKAAALNGKLVVDLVNGFNPVAGDNFDIMNYASESGAFSSETLPVITGDHWLVTIGATDVLLQLLAGTGPTRERGGSSAQAVADTGFASYVPPSALPPASQFDSSLFSNSDGQPSQTPEPSSLLLLGSGLVGIGMWGRRQLRKRRP